MSAAQMRRGLPRFPGGEPWPQAGSSPEPAVVLDAAAVASTQLPAEISPADTSAAWHDEAMPAPPTQATVPTSDVSAITGQAAESTLGFRRGLPRISGGAPWPSEGPTPAQADFESRSFTEPHASDLVDALSRIVSEPLNRAGTAQSEDAVPRVSVRAPLRERLAGLPRVGKIFLGSGLVIVAAAIVVMAARLIVTIPSVAMFVVDYPGATDLPGNAPRGIPAWLGWQHFFNVFLMVLVIRSGLRSRREQRPRAYWAPRRNPAAKVSLTVWFHQSLDILWLINGVAFVVLLFVTGQWMRIVPTSWQIFPNAASAAVQYATLDWPLENGWVNYNSLQVLTYFTTVFIAAPLAAVTGFRMSGMWPASARRLNSLFKMEWARALHFPVMIYFCAFIAVHIFLVLTTGALRNLNHMYASRDVVDWLGFWIFVASLGVIAGAWIAVRPLVIAPIARLFGPVTSR